ncbi:MAG TPA: chemotaxis protein CheW, partial [Paracoccus sp. (in: a-proteobacteria)]|nr:chemotaxis protein CheW [Paracoccus sp. (in: a-proteobacteria)]
AGNGRELVAFRIGRQEFAIDITTVREIRGWTPETVLPHSPPYVRGVINLRGTVLPILDLAARLGLPPAGPTARHVIMVAQVGAQLIGLLVDAVSDILSAGEDSIRPTPEIGGDAARQFVCGVLALEGRMITLVTLDEVLPASAALTAAA